MPETVRPSGGRSVMEQRSEPHDSLDDFPTPPWATRALIEHVIMPLYAKMPEVARVGLRRLSVREPCANRGYMARPLAEYFGAVFASDIFDYGFGYPQQDYLFPGEMIPAHWTVANPPFRLALQFINKSFEAPNWQGTAVIVRTSFLEGGHRWANLYQDNPPTVVAQFVERVIMTKGIVRDPNKEYWDAEKAEWRRPSTATSYCWLVWMKDMPRQPSVWIPPCRRVLEHEGDYPAEPSSTIHRPSPEEVNGLSRQQESV